MVKGCVLFSCLGFVTWCAFMCEKERERKRIKKCLKKDFFRIFSNLIFVGIEFFDDGRCSPNQYLKNIENR